MFLHHNLQAVKNVLDAFATIEKVRIKQAKEIEQLKNDLKLLINLRKSLPKFEGKN